MNEDIKVLLKSQINSIMQDVNKINDELEYKSIKEQLDLLLNIKLNSSTLCSMLSKILDKI